MSEVSVGWRASQAGQVRSLVTCHFDLVDGCQLSCIGCPISTLHPKVTRISVEDFGRCLANIDVRAIGVLRLFNYGEALLHPELPALLKQIPRQAWRARQVEMSTNGQTVDWEVLADAFRTRVVTRLVLSCDGDGTPEEFERMRPPARWSRLMAFVQRASRLRDELHPELELMTRTICTEPEGQARWRALLEPWGWRPEFRRWASLPGASVDMAQDPPGEGVCIFQLKHNMLYVAASGDVVPCCYHPGAGVFGNLKRQTFNQIMAGEGRGAFTEAMRTDRAGMAVCGGCSADATTGV